MAERHDRLVFKTYTTLMYCPEHQPPHHTLQTTDSEKKNNKTSKPWICQITSLASINLTQ